MPQWKYLHYVQSEAAILQSSGNPKIRNSNAAFDRVRDATKGRNQPGSRPTVSEMPEVTNIFPRALRTFRL